MVNGRGGEGGGGGGGRGGGGTICEYLLMTNWLYFPARSFKWNTL
jgi:hypothetical protein